MREGNVIAHDETARRQFNAVEVTATDEIVSTRERTA